MPVVALCALLGLASAAPAAAAPAVDAVPGEVVRYIADGLITDLDEYYGVGLDDTGIDFTDATAAPPIRVFAFTDEFVAGDADAPEVRRLNEWITVISIDKAPTGFAIVSIDQITVSPQLSSFTESSDFATVVAALPEGSRLVHDDARQAWFSLADGELAPLVSGTSRVTEPITLADYRDIVAAWPSEAQAAAPAPDAGSGLLLAGLAVLLIVLLVAAEAFLPSGRRRAKEKRLEAEGEAEAG